jgi:predicted phosphodiesterase
MRIGIFSDAHGNIYAFEKIWSLLKAETADIYFFLGDVCGYYYHQNEIIDILKDCKGLICVKGNHDDIFLKILNDPQAEQIYTQKYGQSLRLFKDNINSNNLEFLKGLPQQYVDPDLRIAIFHGSPFDNLNGYIYPDDNSEEFRKLDYKYVLLGHTHYPMQKQIGKLKIINPGSCGQPRDFYHPSFAILDYESGKVSFRRADYDRRLLIKDLMKNCESNKYLFDVLEREKH